MEVTVLEVQGPIVAPDCLLSLRAGQSRRQGGLHRDQKFTFPGTCQDAVPFKVDVIQLVGRAQLDIGPEDGVYTVPLGPQADADTDADPKQMAIQLQVRGKPLLCGRTRAQLRTAVEAATATAAKQEGDTPQSTTAQVRDYFNNHNIMRVVQALLEALVREQPQDPAGYIADFMDRVALQQQANSNGQGVAASSP